MLSAEMFVNFGAETKIKFCRDISLYTDIPSYCSYWRETAYFVTFPEAAIGRCSRKYLWEEQYFIKVTGCKNY